ncbi:MAG: DivIVA domain-containing protein [Bacilli bacterium]|nr:DivIVA domain-containing protein [Bacilli bacterium]
MDKFNKTLRGYNPVEVNAFLDEVIGQVEKLVSDRKAKDAKFVEMEKLISDLQEQVERYKAVEITLNKTIVAAQDSGEHIRRIARQESDMIVNEARKNSNRIINDSLLRAEKIEYESLNLQRNMSLFKKRLRGIIESQLELVDEIDQIKL